MSGAAHANDSIESSTDGLMYASITAAFGNPETNTAISTWWTKKVPLSSYDNSAKCRSDFNRSFTFAFEDQLQKMLG